MANVVQNNVIVAGTKNTIIQFNLTAVDAQETGTVIYDSSAIATLVGMTDTKNCSIEKIYFSSSVADSGATMQLLFDATTDVPALAIPNNNAACIRFDGGLINKAGSGKTGDIVLTTLGLAAGDNLTLELHVKRKQ